MPKVTSQSAVNPLLPCVVLAGGLAKRLGGGDKPLLRLGDARVLDHVLRRLQGQAAPLALNVNGDPGRFAAFGLPMLADPVPGFPGPLAGVLAAMRWAYECGAAYVLTVPGDSPFIPLDLARRLASPGVAPAYAASGGRAHPTAALWPTSHASKLAAALAAGQRRVRDWADALGACAVTFSIEAGDPFLNINTPADLQQAERLLHDMA